MPGFKPRSGNVMFIKHDEVSGRVDRVRYGMVTLYPGEGAKIVDEAQASVDKMSPGSFIRIELTGKWDGVYQTEVLHTVVKESSAFGTLVESVRKNNL